MSNAAVQRTEVYSLSSPLQVSQGIIFEEIFKGSLCKFTYHLPAKNKKKMLSERVGNEFRCQS